MFLEMFGLVKKELLDSAYEENAKLNRSIDAFRRELTVKHDRVVELEEKLTEPRKCCDCEAWMEKCVNCRSWSGICKSKTSPARGRVCWEDFFCGAFEPKEM